MTLYSPTTTRTATNWSPLRRFASRAALATFGLFAAAVVLAQAAVVNLNTASAAELASAISGVGAAKAAAIVEYRDANGAFETVDDLIDVPGIGLRTIERNRAVLSVSELDQAPGSDQQAALAKDRISSSE